MIDVQSQGFEQAIARLAGVREDLKDKAVRSGLVYAAKPIKVAMKSLVPKKSGALEKAIGHYSLSATAKARLGVPNGQQAILVGPKKGKGWLANILEDGAKAHVIRPKAHRALLFGRFFAKQVHHPGVRARLFMAGALTQGGGNIEAAFFEGLEKFLDRKGA